MPGRASGATESKSQGRFNSPKSSTAAYTICCRAAETTSPGHSALALCPRIRTMGMFFGIAKRGCFPRFPFCTAKLLRRYCCIAIFDSLERNKKLPQMDTVASRFELIHIPIPVRFSFSPQFPWESAQLGVEVTPTDADTGIYEQHISSDIVLAVKQLWRLSGDLNWLKSYLDLVCGVADFWASRVQRRNDGSFGIYGVTGPDEYAVNVNNSAYTNAAARLSLEFAVEICGLLNVSCQNAGAWGEIASQMYIPFDSSRGIHPEYDGYTGGKIKQADVVLLGYPLGLDITDTVRLNDVKYYAARTDVNGPCMTDGIHTIALLSCGLPEAAAEYFPKSFANAKPPFWVWQETPTGGAVNFITGAGGFLQALIFGYGGLRIENGSLLFSPRLAPETSSMKVRGVRYRLAVFDVFWDQDHVIILNLPESAMTIFISDGLRSHEVPAGQRFQFPVSPFSVFAG
eukprot:TRINITY_DN813_c0_g1_i6.p1 TRINITY_DN813_c0_g1~~TRINITY_DN813_c0_g1_i6.p1  ORF type:complete len:458 (-),score=40.63 TRINITY_DN813_c0_g1_i6:59-1432(-)